MSPPRLACVASVAGEILLEVFTQLLQLFWMSGVYIVKQNIRLNEVAELECVYNESQKHLLQLI